MMSGGLRLQVLRSREHIWKLESGIGHRRADASRRQMRRCMRRHSGMADRTAGDHWMGGNGDRLTRFLREERENELVSGLFFGGGGMVGGDQSINNPMKFT